MKRRRCSERLAKKRIHLHTILPELFENHIFSTFSSIDFYVFGVTCKRHYDLVRKCIPVTMNHAELVIDAIYFGYANVLCDLLKHGIRRIPGRIMELGALFGQVEILKLFPANLHKDFYIIAARQGHLDALKWMFGRKQIPLSNVVQVAMDHGQTSIINWAGSLPAQFVNTKSLNFIGILESDDVPTMDCLLTAFGMVAIDNIIGLCIAYSAEELLQYFVEKKEIIKFHTIIDTILRYSRTLDILKSLMTHNVTAIPTSIQFDRIADWFGTEFFQWLIDIDRKSIAVSSDWDTTRWKHPERYQWLVDNGFAR